MPFLNLLQGIKGKTVGKKGLPVKITPCFYYKKLLNTGCCKPSIST
jgi:hypothetical protein